MPTLHTLSAGTHGPRLLLLHGIGGSATAWEPQLDRLGADHICLAPDLPGYGESALHPPSTLASLTTALAHILDQHPAHVIGVSFGAMLALALAHSHPDLVQSLVLADATLGRAYLPEPERRQWLAMRQALADDLVAQSDTRAAQIAAPGAPTPVVQAIARHMRRARPEGYMAVARIIAGTDAKPWLPSITQPAHILCGDQDNVTGPQVSQTLVDLLPNARLQTIADAGHAPHLEQPDEFAQAVRHHLARLGP